MKKQLIQATAKAFALAHGEDDLFDATWDLYRRVAEPHSPRERAQKAASEALAVTLGYEGLKAAVEGTPTRQRGHRRIKRAPVAARYVVFSDHHLTHDGHRHDFFRSSGNLALYVALLQAYRDRGYTVIEDGDVEDLVVFDPALERAEVNARRSVSLRELRTRRLATRLAQLDRTLTCPGNQPLIRMWRELAAEGRLLRVSGNHDYDLQRPAFWKRVSAELPGLERPFDYVLLDDAARQPKIVVAHGHQFDPNTAPPLAPRYGETISECLGAWFQGPDRHWSAQLPADGPAAWGGGARPFRNNLVNTKVGTDHGWAGVFEEVFQRNIAWEYFEHGALQAILSEVATGERFFKFRHLDEERLRDALIDAFPDPTTRPILVLGHSHEPRLRARHAGTGEAFPHYVNTASAGLFQNLIWGVELNAGEPRVVSWRRDEHARIERRTWRDANDGENGWLMPDAPSPLS